MNQILQALEEDVIASINTKQAKKLSWADLCEREDVEESTYPPNEGFDRVSHVSDSL